MAQQFKFSKLGLPPLPSSSPDTVAALLWAREVLQKHQANVQGVRNPKGIDELKPIKIGGVDQWCHIRGRNRSNPILLYLHGGPGGAIIGGTLSASTRPWEDYFTLVFWDQRQCGKSYYPADDEDNPLTVNQLINDTCELIKHLRHKFSQEKIFVLGHSWGSVLGMHALKRYPDWIHAYIGVGQVVNTIEAERKILKRLLNHATDKNELNLIETLNDIIPYLDFSFPEREKSWIKYCDFARRELSRLAGETFMHHLFWDDALDLINLDNLISPQRTLTDLSNSIIGDEVAVARAPYLFTKEFLDVDLPNDIGSSFDVPIFFFTGSHDWHTPHPLSDSWFNNIDAPYKKLIHFDESCHAVVNEEPGKVLIALVNNVLPIAGSKPSER
ncbi:alpha/beta hydrolase [SAR92 clade bacterium H231]|nr:alpha/beta hydrolase [SAR92 clade bacterium H231]